MVLLNSSSAAALLLIAAAADGYVSRGGSCGRGVTPSFLGGPAPSSSSLLRADSRLFPGYESFNHGGEGGDLTVGGGLDEEAGGGGGPVVYEYDDFAGFDSAQLAPRDGESGGTVAPPLDGDDGSSSTFASSLERRMQQVEGGSNRLVRLFSSLNFR